MKLTKETLKSLIMEVKRDTTMLLKKPLLVEGDYRLVKLNETTIKRVAGQHMDGGFIVITADRSCDAELKRDCTPEEEKEQIERNNKNNKELEKDLKAHKFGYVPVYGGYREKISYKVEDGDTIGSIAAEAKMPIEIFKQINKLQTDEDLVPGLEVFIMVDTETPETGFLIGVPKDGRYTIGDLYDFGLAMSIKYNQDSFFYKPPKEEDSNAYYIKQDGGIDATFTDFTLNDLSQVFYTQLKKRPHERITALPESFDYYMRRSPRNLKEARRRRGEIFYNFDRKLKRGGRG